MADCMAEACDRILSIQSGVYCSSWGMAGDVVTCMYHTGLDPFPKQERHVARQPRERKMQRAAQCEPALAQPRQYRQIRRTLPTGYLRTSLPARSISRRPRA